MLHQCNTGFRLNIS